MLEKLKTWLQPVDKYNLECDGLTTVIRILLTRESISYRINSGTLSSSKNDAVPVMHFWIELSVEGALYYIDFRARMWLGHRPEVPHGIFLASDTGVARYDNVTEVTPSVVNSDGFLFSVLTDSPLEQYPRL